MIDCSLDSHTTQYSLVWGGQFTQNLNILLTVFLLISLDSFGVSCLVLEISAVEISALSLI